MIIGKILTTLLIVFLTYFIVSELCMHKKEKDILKLQIETDKCVLEIAKIYIEAEEQLYEEEKRIVKNTIKNTIQSDIEILKLFEK